jgi:putative integral membrane protein (TIGR02587 family)
LLAYVAATFVVLLGYNRYAGLHPGTSFAEVIIDSVEEMGIGLVVAAGVLAMLGRIHTGMPLSEAVGKVVVEAMTVAVGVSVGTAQLGGNGNGNGNGGGNDRRDPGDPRDHGRPEPHFYGQIVIAFCGAILFAANVAPTDEVVLVALDLPSWKLLVIVVVSVLLAAMVLFYSDFVGSKHHVRNERPMSIAAGAAISYAVALAASAMILYFFGRFDGASPATGLAMVVVLGLVASLGASAGRLLLQ